MLLGINYAPEKIGIAVYSSGLAEEMAGRGVETEVITALPYYPDWQVFEGWRGPFWRRRTGENGERIIHCPLWVPKTPTGKKRILHHAAFALTALPVAIWKALFFRPDIVFVVAPAMVAAPVGVLAAKLAGAKSWMHIQDFEVEAALATGLLTEEGRTGRYARAFEHWILQRFDVISSISRPMLDKLREKGVAAQRIREFRNWADLSRIEPMDGPSGMREELGIETPYVALYSGNLSNKQGLEILPEAARLLQHREDLTFVICGDGPMREQLVGAAQDLANIRFLPLQPIDRLNDLLAMADVHLLPQIAGAADLVLPSKLTNMLASGRPVVATADAGTALAEEVEGAGINVAPGDAAAMAKALDALLSDRDLRLSLGRIARERALTNWNKTAILDTLLASFERLVAGGSSAGADVDLPVAKEAYTNGRTTSNSEDRNQNNLSKS